jgi:hypothetical protein
LIYYFILPFSENQILNTFEIKNRRPKNAAPLKTAKVYQNSLIVEAGAF